MLLLVELLCFCIFVSSASGNSIGTRTLGGLANCYEHNTNTDIAKAAAKFGPLTGNAFCLRITGGAIYYGYDNAHGGQLWGSRLKVFTAADDAGSGLTPIGLVGVGSYVDLLHIFNSSSAAQTAGLASSSLSISLGVKERWIYVTTEDIFPLFCGDNSGSESVELLDGFCPSLTPTPTRSSTKTSTLTRTPTPTRTPTRTATITRTFSRTKTSTPTRTSTRTTTFSVTPTVTRTPDYTRTSSSSPTGTVTIAMTNTITPTFSATRTYAPYPPCRPPYEGSIAKFDFSGGRVTDVFGNTNNFLIPHGSVIYNNNVDGKEAYGGFGPGSYLEFSPGLNAALQGLNRWTITYDWYLIGPSSGVHSTAIGLTSDCYFQQATAGGSSGPLLMMFPGPDPLNSAGSTGVGSWHNAGYTGSVPYYGNKKVYLDGVPGGMNITNLTLPITINGRVGQSVDGSNSCNCWITNIVFVYSYWESFPLQSGCWTPAPTRTPGGGFSLLGVKPGSDLIRNPLEALLTKKKPIVVFPNPANHTAHVAYYLEKSEKVRIKVVSLSGQELENRELGEQPSGIGTYNLGLNHYSSGIYFVALEVDSGWGWEGKGIFKMGVVK